jgi:DNA gyrase subunit A
MGIKTIDTNALGAVGKIAAARVVSKEDDLTLISVGGQVLRTKIKDIKVAGRATRGVIIFKMNKSDSVATIAIIRPSDLKKVDPDVDGGVGGDEEEDDSSED